MKVLAARTLRRRIELLLLLLLVPLLLLVVINAYAAAQRDRREIQQQAYRLVASAAGNVEQVIRGAAQMVDVLSPVAPAPEEFCHAAAAALIAVPSVSNAAVAARNGDLLCAARGDARSAHVPGPWIDAAWQSREITVTGLLSSPLTREPSLLVAQPRDRDAAVVRVAAVNLAVVVDHLKAIPLPAQSSINLIGPDHVIVARIPDNEVWRGELAPQTLLRELVDRTDGVFETIGVDGIRRLYGFRRLQLPHQPLVLTVGMPSATVYSDLNRRLWINLTTLAVVALGAFSFARKLSGELFERKVGSVLRAARLLSAGDLSARTGEAWTADELGELSRGFDAMAWTLEQRTAELERSVQQLRELTARLESVREDERTRISREIHDELGQALTGIRMDLDRAESRLGDVPLTAGAAIARKLASARALVDAASETARRISRQLRPSVLDVLGLRAAVEWQLDEFRTRTAIDAELLAPPSLPALNESSTIAVFRILQETLTNVMRHAQARRVTVRLDQEDGDVVLEVMDDGRGFDVGASAFSDRLGLLGIRERATALGGAVDVTSTPGGGTTVHVRLPITSETAA